MEGSELKGLVAYWIAVVVVVAVALALGHRILLLIGAAGLIGALISTYLTWRGSRGRKVTP